jgi:hypothetical protein
MTVYKRTHEISGKGILPLTMALQDRACFRNSDRDCFFLAFNLELDSISRISDLNESVIEELLAALDGHKDAADDLYWLTLARINELALLCAGNYADACEYLLAGDLLLNPRRITIHVRGALRAVTKVRHKALTEQFRHVADSPPEVVDWLKRETLQEIAEEALLPHLDGLLNNSGRLNRRYLDFAVERKTRIASLIGFLASSGFKDGTHLHRWMESADPADRRILESRLCRFDCGTFTELGKDIRRMGEGHAKNSRFLAGNGADFSTSRPSRVILEM